MRELKQMSGPDEVDVLIIGAGPAGLQAAMHAVRKRATVLVVGRIEKSSLYRAHVENYLFVDGVSAGSDLLAVGLAQINRFGAEHRAEDVLSVEQQGERFLVQLEGGRTVASLSLIFATGTSRKKLKVKGEKELSGKGVSYCVDCDANFYRNVPVAVVGNESAAVDGALTMLEYAADVFLIARELHVSDELRQRLETSRVHLIHGTWVSEIRGEGAVSGILLDNDTVIEVEGVFIELGAKGAMELATTLGVLLDSETFTHIETDREQRTNVPGIYAAGDITGHPYQIAKAVGEGCAAGMAAATHALKLKKSAAQSR
jgi:thioredoxin reductase (NADPH)